MSLNPYKLNEMFCLTVQVSTSTEGEMLVALNGLQIRLTFFAVPRTLLGIHNSIFFVLSLFLSGGSYESLREQKLSKLLFLLIDIESTSR